jgi:dTDP-4-amino-4,6-dideoxygalactose transaminase
MNFQGPCLKFETNCWHFQIFLSRQYERGYLLPSCVPHAFNGQRDFPISEDCASRIFSLPMHPYIKEEDQKRIIKILCALPRHDHD